MPKLKTLLGRGSPRSNIPKVEYNNQFLPCDRLIARYIPEWHAYQIMRNYFLQHKEYTHLVLATDDIVVLKKDIEQLQKNLGDDYPVIAGIMNVDQDDENQDVPNQFIQKRRLHDDRELPGRDSVERMRVDVSRGIAAVKDLQAPRHRGFPTVELLIEVVPEPTDGLRQDDSRGNRVDEGR